VRRRPGARERARRGDRPPAPAPVPALRRGIAPRRAREIATAPGHPARRRVARRAIWSSAGLGASARAPGAGRRSAAP